MEPNLSYEAAFNELNQIASEIQNETISIDLLSQKVTRASELISFCQSKLRATEADVTNIINQMDQGNQSK